MKLAILGTGIVGRTLGSKLAAGGHEVMMGSRSADNPRAIEWAQEAGAKASQGTFAKAAAFGEVALNCTAGTVSLEALSLAGAGNLRGKVLIDIANPLDFSRGFPPSLAFCNTESLGERIQSAYPETLVVKTLNTMNCSVMVNPGIVPGRHNAFLSGNDAAAKTAVAGMLGSWFGWNREDLIDLGDITTARGTEMLLPIWLRLWNVVQTPNFNFAVAVGAKPESAG